VDGEAGEYYVALYPYESAEAGDLPFDAGEVIFVSHKEGQWWTGQIGTDRVGVFPANYVATQGEVEASADGAVEHTEENNATNSALESEPAPEPVTKSYNEEHGFSDQADSDSQRRTELEPYEEAEIKREMSEIGRQPPPKSPKTTKSRRYEIATVLANYQGSSEGQLTLTRGQLVTVRKKSSSGWWEGELQVCPIRLTLNVCILEFTDFAAYLIVLFTCSSRESKESSAGSLDRT
jgi:hypothetical protein